MSEVLRQRGMCNARFGPAHIPKFVADVVEAECQDQIEWTYVEH